MYVINKDLMIFTARPIKLFRVSLFRSTPSSPSPTSPVCYQQMSTRSIHCEYSCCTHRSTWLMNGAEGRTEDYFRALAVSFSGLDEGNNSPLHDSFLRIELNSTFSLSSARFHFNSICEIHSHVHILLVLSLVAFVLPSVSKCFLCCVYT